MTDDAASSGGQPNILRPSGKGVHPKRVSFDLSVRDCEPANSRLLHTVLSKADAGPNVSVSKPDADVEEACCAAAGDGSSTWLSRLHMPHVPFNSEIGTGKELS